MEEKTIIIRQTEKGLTYGVQKFSPTEEVGALAVQLFHRILKINSTIKNVPKDKDNKE